MNPKKLPKTSPLDFEIANMRHNVNLLNSQIKSGRVDGDFLVKQVGMMGELLAKLEAEQGERKSAKRFEALYNVSGMLGSSLDLQTVLNQAMDAVINLTNAERGFLMLRDDDGNLKPKVARNLDQRTLSSEEFRYSRTVVNQVLDSQKPILTTNAAKDPRFSGQASIVAQSLRSIMATPLRVRGQGIGVVYVDSQATVGLFSEEDLTVLDAISGQAAVAIENALLFDATDQQLAMRVEQLQQLRRIDLLLNQTLDASKAMFHTLEWACRLSEATSGHLGLVEGDPPQIREVHYYRQDDDITLQKKVYLDQRYPQALSAIQSGKTLKLTSEQNNGHTLLIVPIHREQKVIGVVILKNETAGDFTPDQQDLVERVVARAATAIENARLYAAVQAADRAKSEFVGVVAHDLKTPMTSIAGYADLTLMQGELSDRQVDFVNRIKNTVERMEVLVSDLADISRVESGHFFMEVSQVRVADIVQAVQDTTMPEIQARKHTFKLEIEPDLPDIQADYYRLLQVLTNLVSNAYKYTPDGGTITLSARNTGVGVEFGVADTGIGLSPKDIVMMGTKFWRAEDNYTRSQPGTGLGFAITRSLVELMGGKIHIESTVGKGSRFTFSILTGQD